MPLWQWVAIDSNWGIYYPWQHPWGVCVWCGGGRGVCVANMPGSSQHDTTTTRSLSSWKTSPHHLMCLLWIIQFIYLLFCNSFIKTQSAKYYSASQFPQLPVSADCAPHDCSGILYAASPFGISNCISQLHAWKTHECKVALWKLNYNATLHLYLKTCCSYHHLVLWTFKYSV